MDPETTNKIEKMQEWISSAAYNSNIASDVLASNVSIENNLTGLAGSGYSDTLRDSLSADSARVDYSNYSTTDSGHAYDYVLRTSDTTDITTFPPNTVNLPYQPYSPLQPIQSYGDSFTTIFKEKDSLSKENMKDLLSEIEEKDRECDSKIDEIFEQMKSDRTKTSVLNPVFQYYVGMKEGLDILIRKLNRFLEEEN